MITLIRTKSFGMVNSCIILQHRQLEASTLIC